MTINQFKLNKMKTLSLSKYKQFILLLLSLVALALLTMFNSCKKSAEKTSESIIEKSMGGDASVDLDDEKIVIETEEGTFTSDATVRSWPKEIPNEVPEFSFGKMANLATQNLEESTNWTFVFEEVPANALNDYKAILKDNGFKVSSVSIAGAGGQVTGEKDNIIVAVMAGDEMATVSVGIEK